MKLAVIGGTGALDLFQAIRTESITTPFGAPSDRPRRVKVDQHEIWFLARHGDPHRIPPHKVNYRANVHALKILGADSILAISAVGAIASGLEPGSLLVPDQLIDYTWGRAHTFSDGGSAPLRHIDFSRPFDGPARKELVAAAGRAGRQVVDGGCHAVTQGPRLETAAEISRLADSGCDVVGMTAMPETALAREAGLDYANLCVVANSAAGREEGTISEHEIHRVLQTAMGGVRDVLTALVKGVAG